MKPETLKRIILNIGTAIILLYLILVLIESQNRIISFIILIPILIWPYLAYRYEKQAAIFAFMIGIIVMVWFAIDFNFIRTEKIFWHIPVFLIIAPLPAFVLAWLLLVFMKKKRESL